MPFKTARFYNASWPGLLDDVRLRGYVNPQIREVRVDVEAEYVPEGTEDTYGLLVVVQFIVILGMLVYIVCTHRRRVRYAPAPVNE
jgi:hypothetical protein